MSNFTSQRERLAFVEKQLQNPWLFSGAEERAIVRELVAIAKETDETLDEFMRRFQDGEG